LLGDIIQGTYLQYELILTKPNKEEISVLDAYSIEYSPRFNGIDVLNFQINYNLNGWLQEKNIDFDNIKGNYLILMNIKKNDEVIKQQYFTIWLTEDIGVEKDSKRVSCYAYQYLWGKKKIRSYKDVRKIYDGQTYSFSDNTVGGLMDYIIQYKLKGWGVSSISPSLQNIYRTFDISEMTLIELVSEIEKQYNCILIFNTVNQTIQIKAITEIGENKGLFISEENLMKNIKRNIKVDEVITKLYVYNNEGDSINAKNITGQSYLLNFNYYRTLDYMSQNLLDALDAYDIVLTNNQSVFEGYLTTLSGYQTTLLIKQNELAVLNAEKLVIEDALDVQKNTYSSNNSTYDSIYDDLQDKEQEIEDKEDEISATQVLINGVNANITTLNTLVSMETNFTESQLIELDRLTFEDTIQLNITDATQLYEEGLYYSNLKSTPPIEFTIETADILSLVEYQSDWDKILSLGDFINVDYRKFNVNSLEVRLIEFTHSPDSNSLSLKFSNKNELNTDFLYLNDIWKKPFQASVTAEIERPTYKEYEVDKDDILFNGDIIDTADTEIKSGSNFINSRGFIGSDIGGTGAIQIKNDKIIFSDSDPIWENFYTLLSGNGLYMETSDKTSRTLIYREGGFQLDLWNTELNDWRNAIYLGLDDSSKPSLFMDNAYISLTEVIAGINKNNIYIDPSVGIKIQTNTGTNELPVWENRLTLSNDGYVIAELLRTSPSSDNYISLEEMWLSFNNTGLEKMILGVYYFAGDYLPYFKLGAGDLSGRNYFEMAKYTFGLGMVFANTDGTSSGILFVNSDELGYSDGGILIDADGDIEFTAGGVINFNNSNIINFDYSYSKSETNSRINDAINDHEATYHSLV
jgi:hypothetical protein